MNEIKSVEELFDKIKKMGWLHEYAEDGIINKTDFTQILAEHDQEIIQMIDEFFVKMEDTLDVCPQHKCIENGCGRCQDYYKSKTELKQKLVKK